MGRCGVLNLFLSYFSSDVLVKPTCDSKDCEKNITMFCVQCESFLCNTCNNAHTKCQPTHSTLPLNVDKENTFKVLCNTHNTACKYMCCDIHTCTYCIHRDHSKHNYSNLDNEIKSINQRLNVEMQKYRLFKQSINITNEFIAIARNLFDQSIKLRKQNCINSYIDLVNKEEKMLRQQFNVTLSDFERNLTAHNLEKLNELSKKSEIEFTLLKKNIVESIQQLSFREVQSLDVMLSDPKVINDHPLGEIIVDRRDVGAADSLFTYTDAEIAKKAVDPTKMLKEFGNIYQRGKFNRNIVFHFVDRKNFHL